MYVDLEILELDIFSTFLDVTVRHWDLPNTPIESNELRKHTHSECESLTGEIKSLWSNGRQELLRTYGNFQKYMQTIHEFDRANDVQNGKLFQYQMIACIDQEVEKLSAMESNLANVSSFFKPMIEKSTKSSQCLERNSNICKNWMIFIRRCFVEVFEMRSIYKLYQNLNEKIEGVVKTIADTRSLLRNKIGLLRKLKIQAKQSENKFVSREYFLMRALGWKLTYIIYRRNVLRFMAVAMMQPLDADVVADTSLNII